MVDVSPHFSPIESLSIAFQEMLRWLRPISESTQSSERLFVSGSRNACAFVPNGFVDLLAVHRRAVQEHKPHMLRELAPGGAFPVLSAGFGVVFIGLYRVLVSFLLFK